MKMQSRFILLALITVLHLAGAALTDQLVAGSAESQELVVMFNASTQNAHLQQACGCTGCTLNTVSTYSSWHRATPCASGYVARISGLQAQCTDGTTGIFGSPASTFDIDVMSPSDYANYQQNQAYSYYVAAHATATSCFNQGSAAIGSSDNDMYVVIKCRNAVYNCPVYMTFAASCVLAPTPSPASQDCVVSAFSAWSTCSATCGGGTQTATRTIITPASGGGAACPALSTSQSCNTQSCSSNVDCVVSAYSAWSTCSKTCGGGTQTATRTIITPASGTGAACPALSTSQACNTQACPVLCPGIVVTAPSSGYCQITTINGVCTTNCPSVFSAYGSCQGSCSTYTCTGCSGVGNLCQSAPCADAIPPVDCVVSAFSAWSNCSATCGGGTQYASRTIITSASGGGAACPALSTSQSCNTQSCSSNVDCVVSAYSAWSTCSKTCGGGTQTATRTIITPASGTGAACPALSTSQACNTQACPPPFIPSPAVQLSPYGDRSSCATIGGCSSFTCNELNGYGMYICNNMVGAVCPMPPCDNFCSSFLTASDCLCGTGVPPFGKCGWCGSSNKCVYTTAPNQALGAGDVVGTSCTNAGTQADFQANTYTTPGPFADCSARYTTCTSCVAWGFWCTIDNKCHYGGAGGATDGFNCSGSAWIGTANKCPVPTSPPTPQPTSTPTPSSTPVPTASPSRALPVMVSVKLSANIAVASTIAFQSQFIATVAASLNISVTRVTIGSIVSGSVIVNVVILPDAYSTATPTPSVLALNLVQQAQSPTSSLSVSVANNAALQTTVDSSFTPSTSVLTQCSDGTYQSICPTAPSPAPTPAPASGSNNIILIGAVCGGVAIAIGIAVACYCRKKSAPLAYGKQVDNTVSGSELSVVRLNLNAGGQALPPPHGPNQLVTDTGSVGLDIQQQNPSFGTLPAYSSESGPSMTESRY